MDRGRRGLIRTVEVPSTIEWFIYPTCMIIDMTHDGGLRRAIVNLVHAIDNLLENAEEASGLTRDILLVVIVLLFALLVYSLLDFIHLI